MRHEKWQHWISIFILLFVFCESDLLSAGFKDSGRGRGNGGALRYWQAFEHCRIPPATADVQVAMEADAFRRRWSGMRPLSWWNLGGPQMNFGARHYGNLGRTETSGLANWGVEYRARGSGGRSIGVCFQRAPVVGPADTGMFVGAFAELSKGGREL